MKKIILIGDSTLVGSSVSSGYGGFVREHFTGGEEVVLPIENCQDTRFTYACLDELFDPEVLASADVIHWNNGLWDTLHFLGNERCVVPLSKYIELMGRIYDKLRTLSPGAKIIFATTVPVVEYDGIHGYSYRKNSEIAEYNLAALDFFSDKDVAINDLYGTCVPFDVSMWTPDCVHLTDGASRILAEQVCRVIRSVL